MRLSNHSTSALKHKSRKIRKSLKRRQNTHTNHSIMGGNSTRKSNRLNQGLIHIPTKELGTGSRMVTDSELQRFVDVEIDDQTPQVVSIPVRTERHAFLVDIQPNNGRIMISDWGGDKNKLRGAKYVKKNKRRIINVNYNENWLHYSQLMETLESKYNLPIKYYAIDAEIYEASDRHHTMHSSSGGCSYYIYKWIGKYYPGYYA
jgi:hypothetical protein